MDNKLYDKLKFIAQILLPAVATLYFTLAQIWGLPAAEEVVGTIVAIDTFLGVLLGLSSNAYKNSDERLSGVINLHESADKKTYSLELNHPAEELENKDEVVFKVNQADN